MEDSRLKPCISGGMRSCRLDSFAVMLRWLDRRKKPSKTCQMAPRFALAHASEKEPLSKSGTS